MKNKTTRRCLSLFCVLVAGSLLPSVVSDSRAQSRELTPAEQKAADMRLPDLDRTGLEPAKREPVTVVEGERNPFGLVSLPEEKEVQVAQKETEEMKLRRILSSMRVSGVGGAGGSYRVALGSMQLRQGDVLPRLFADQAEVLRVSSITDRQVVFSFEEKDSSIPPRTVELAYDLNPRPRSLLVGELFQQVIPFTPKGAADLKPIALPAAKSVVEGAKVGELQGLVDRSFELMGEPEYRTEDEQPPESKD